MDTRFSVSLVSWRAAEPQLRALRTVVFMQEQGVPAELEWDGLDDASQHALASDAAGNAIGCGRLLPDGHIGRIAVLPEWRRCKVGTALMEALVAAARAQGLPQVELAAQTYAVPFYQRFGFVAHGAVFMDAGMPHVSMCLRL